VEAELQSFFALAQNVISHLLYLQSKRLFNNQLINAGWVSEPVWTLWKRQKSPEMNNNPIWIFQVSEE